MDKQKRIVEVLNRISSQIQKNTKPSDPHRWLLGCSWKVWHALGLVPEDYDVWHETGLIPERSLRRVALSRARARAKAFEVDLET